MKSKKFEKLHDSIYRSKLLLCCGWFLFSSVLQTDFLTEQRRYERVRTAMKDKHETIEKLLGEHNLSTDNLHLLLVATKNNDLLDVYA